MDSVVPLSRFPLGRRSSFNRRQLAVLAVAGVAGPARAEEGVPVMSRQSPDEVSMTLEALAGTVAALAAAYETTSPTQTARALRSAERLLTATVGDGLPDAKRRDAKALYGQVLVMDANAASDIGKKPEAIRTGQLAVTLAHEAGDSETAGHAWAVVSAALLSSKSPRAAVKAARKGVQCAGRSPGGVMALVAEANAWAALGSVSNVVDTVSFAEERHASLDATGWGVPGYSLRSYHPGYLKAFGGAALLRVGSYPAALPRLAEAATLLDGPTVAGIRSFVLLCQARAQLSVGAVGEAHTVAMDAVAASAHRPASWVAAAVEKMNLDTGGAFADLVEQTRHWPA
jgi:hypothetical protein